MAGGRLSKQELENGRYPRQCRGTYGPHTILSVDDELDEGHEKFVCRACHIECRKRARKRWRDKNQVRELNAQNRRRRLQSEVKQKGHLYGSSST